MRNQIEIEFSTLAIHIANMSRTARANRAGKNIYRILARRDDENLEKQHGTGRPITLIIIRLTSLTNARVESAVSMVMAMGAPIPPLPILSSPLRVSSLTSQAPPACEPVPALVRRADAEQNHYGAGGLEYWCAGLWGAGARSAL